MADKVYPEGVTAMDHVNHDMKMGRFPNQSSVETFLKERETLVAQAKVGHLPERESDGTRAEIAVQAAMQSCEADGNKCSCKHFGWQFSADEPRLCNARLSAAYETLSIAQPEAAEKAYGILWRIYGASVGYAHDARQILRDGLGKEARRRGIAWANERYGKLGPDPALMLNTEERAELVRSVPEVRPED